ncbi:MAG: deoxyribodipyrimidine photo-lyase [Rickettsiaceae bacterium]|nr:deoxyribodipyrimidine photo-lyase [Rickettsiaceae bacterium]
MKERIIYWHRQDLRLKDNPALNWAASKGIVIPLYINNSQLFDDMYIGAAQKWWLHHSLSALQTEYAQYNINLILRSGDPREIIEKLLQELNISAITWNRCYDPHSIARDMQLKAYFKQQAIEIKTFNSSLLTEPSHILNQNNEFYKVFTPYWKNCKQIIKHEDIVPMPKLEPVALSIATENLDDWELLPHSPNWAKGFGDYWQPGEKGAQQNIASFFSNGLCGYHQNRDIPSCLGTSRISPHLKFGEISPRQIWNKLCQIAEQKGYTEDIDRYSAELGWREFSYYLLFHFPNLMSKSFNHKFADFPWITNEKYLKAWQKGMTGYPMVDAGMRELWHTGWMHNRVRMIVGSFLTKHLLISWQKGAEWFLYTLVDADIANNSAGWQWISGSGADAAPYFRIFNPVTQGQKFDSEGSYIRNWVPEIAGLPDQYIHSPWEASDELLEKCGIKLGADYPHPIVNHSKARESALAAYGQIKKL